MVLELATHRVIIPIKPGIAQFDGLGWIHSNEVSNMLEDQILHFLYGHTIGHSLLLKEPVLVVLLLVRGFFVIRTILLLDLRDSLTALKTILNLIKPDKHISFNGANLEEHGQAFLKVALKLLQKHTKLEKWSRF